VRRSGRLPTLVAVVAAAVVIAGAWALWRWFDQPSVRLTIEGGDDLSSVVAYGSSQSSGWAVVETTLACVTPSGSVTVTAVEPIESVNEFTVTDFAFIAPPSDPGLGGIQHRRLRDIWGDRATATVSAPCSGESRARMMVEVAAPERYEFVSTPALRVTFVEDGRERSVESYTGIFLCRDGDIDDHCRQEADEFSDTQDEFLDGR